MPRSPGLSGPPLGVCVTLGKPLSLSVTWVPTQESEGPWCGLRCIPMVARVPLGRRNEVSSDPEDMMDTAEAQPQ